MISWRFVALCLLYPSHRRFLLVQSPKLHLWLTDSKRRIFRLGRQTLHGTIRTAENVARITIWHASNTRIQLIHFMSIGSCFMFTSRDPTTSRNIEIELNNSHIHSNYVFRNQFLYFIIHTFDSHQHTTHHQISWFAAGTWLRVWWTDTNYMNGHKAAGQTDPRRAPNQPCAFIHGLLSVGCSPACILWFRRG